MVAATQEGVVQRSLQRCRLDITALLELLQRIHHGGYCLPISRGGRSGTRAPTGFIKGHVVKPVTLEQAGSKRHRTDMNFRFPISEVHRLCAHGSRCSSTQHGHGEGLTCHARRIHSREESDAGQPGQGQCVVQGINNGGWRHGARCPRVSQALTVAAAGARGGRGLG